MGLTIRARYKPKKTIDLGYDGFARLRLQVAALAGDPWDSHYRKLFEPAPMRDSKALEAFDKETDNLLNRKVVPRSLVDFCTQPDTNGIVHYGACRQLLGIIGNYTDDVDYGYPGRPDCATFQDFKDILEDCVDRHCDLIWH